MAGMFDLSSDRCDFQPQFCVTSNVGAVCRGQTRVCQTPIRGKSHDQKLDPEARKSDNTEGLSWPQLSTPRCNLYMAVFILITCCCSLTSAVAVSSLPPSISDPRENATEDLRSTIAELGTILVDQRPKPPGVAWQVETVQLDLVRRQTGDSFTLKSVATESTSATSTSTSATSSSTVASSGTPSATPAVNTALPTPFDSSLGANFTSQACPTFITNFLSNATFQACLPLSVLLESSHSFFEAEKSIVRITQTLDFSCRANHTTCNDLMSSLALNLTSSANCGADYAAQNPTVMQAYTGLITYKPLYQASCLKNPSTGSYCFADAVTNASSPTDSYVYYIALNQTLPSGYQPTCNPCLQNTMAVFDNAAANRSQPVSSTYIDAAKQINIQCGPGFVNSSIPAPLSGAGSITSLHPSPGLLLLVIFALAWLL